jgi:hypothetical protein
MRGTGSGRILMVMVAGTNLGTSLQMWQSIYNVVINSEYGMLNFYGHFQ